MRLIDAPTAVDLCVRRIGCGRRSIGPRSLPSFGPPRRLRAASGQEHKAGERRQNDCSEKTRSVYSHYIEVVVRALLSLIGEARKPAADRAGLIASSTMDSIRLVWFSVSLLWPESFLFRLSTALYTIPLVVFLLLLRFGLTPVVDRYIQRRGWTLR